MRFKQRCLSSAALTAVASAAFIGGPVYAQNDQEEIIVTGSLIRGTPEDAALPVDVITADELGKQGSPSILELVKALPTSNGVLGDSNQFDSRSQGAEGIASVNLRGLGPARTLVLLNNRRMVSAGNGVPAVDINMIPPSAIARLEVLKDGAAATYGSDAIGGVVNFITKTNQDGFQASADYKYVKGSKGDYNLGLSWGHQTENFNFFAAAAFQHRSELMTTDRDFALLDYVSNPEGGWTGGGNPANFLTLNGLGAPNSGIRADPDCAVLGGYVKADIRCATQYTGFDALTDTENRAQVFFDAQGDITDSVKLRINALYGYTEIPHYRTSPSYLLTQSPSASVGGSPSGFVVPATNPGFQALVAEYPGFIPAGSVAALFPTLLFRPYLVGGNPAFRDGKRGNDAGSASGMRESNSFRVSSDLSFALSDKLDLTLSGTYHLYDRYIDGFDSFGDRVQRALRGFGGPNCTGAVAGANGCLWLNPFGNSVAANAITGQANNGAIGPANSAELTNWFFVKSYSRAITELWVADATISGGTGINLPGGEVNFGFGAQYRKNEFKIKYGANNNLAVNPCKDTPVNGNTTCTPQNGALAFLGTGNGISLFAIPADAAGVTLATRKLTDARSHADLTLSGVTVSADAKLGDAKVLEQVLDRARIVATAEMLGMAEHSFQVTLDYMKQRVQFGEIIARFQALQHRMSDLFTRIELMRSAVEGALSALDSGSDVSALASVAKATANDVLNLVSREVIQLHGGIGMTDEYDIGFYIKRARVLENAWGSSSFHRERFAQLGGY